MELRELILRLALDGPRKRVLVVEDLASLRIRLVDFLAKLGHEPVGLLGIRSIEGPLAVGPGEDGDLEVDLRSIDVAFLDHYFLGREHNGRTLTEALRRTGDARIVAMSSSPGANRRMLEAGADVALVKPEIVALLG
jgi:CheY-like chemotaxis protein